MEYRVRGQEGCENQPKGKRPGPWETHPAEKEGNRKKNSVHHDQKAFRKACGHNTDGNGGSMQRTRLANGLLRALREFLVCHRTRL